TVLEHRQQRIRAADRVGDLLAQRSEGGAGVVVPARTGGQRLPPLLDEVAVGGQALLAEHVGAALRGAEEDLVVAREAAADESRGEVLGFGLRGPAGPEVSLLDLLDGDGEAPGAVDVGVELLDQAEGEQAEFGGAPGEAGVDEKSGAQQAVPLGCIDQQIHQLAERLLCEGLAQKLLVWGVRVVGVLLDGCSLRLVITGCAVLSTEPCEDSRDAVLAEEAVLGKRAAAGGGDASLRRLDLDVVIAGSGDDRGRAGRVVAEEADPALSRVARSALEDHFPDHGTQDLFVDVVLPHGTSVVEKRATCSPTCARLRFLTFEALGSPPASASSSVQ